MAEAFETIIKGMDLRFVRIRLEFQTLIHISEVLRQQLPDVIEKKLDSFIVRARELDDDDPVKEILILNYNTQFYQFVQRDIPRFYNSPLLLILYAICEAAIVEIAGIVQNETGSLLGINELKGGFINRSTKYFEKVLRFKLFKKNEDWKRFKILTALRNAIAHANGRIDMVEKDLMSDIKKYAKSFKGINIESGVIVISLEFVEETISLMNTAILDLMSRVEKAFPPSDKGNEDA